jgi:putative transcriptional regulator
MVTSFYRNSATGLIFRGSLGGLTIHEFLDMRNMDFFKYKNKVKPEKGKLLISEPFLPDPNFERTIILLCENNSEGSFGFVLNKPSLANVSDVMDDIKDYDTPAMVGGPVQQDTLHYLHRYPGIDDAVEILDGVFWGGNFERVLFLLDSKQLPHKDIRFFLGYSGWSAGQLEEELDQDSWIVSDQASEELIFDTEPDAMWKKTLKIMGGRFSIYSNYPKDPRLN